MSWVFQQLKSKAKDGDWSGLWSMLQRALYERYYERRFNIESHGYIDPGELGIGNEECMGYEGTDYRSLIEIMRKLGVREGKDVFLDLGSGKGRALIMAATQPFKRIIGVEISPELAQAAQENLQRARKRLKCTDVHVVTGDARTFDVPDDVTVVFMFNPFRGEALARILENLKSSLSRVPRQLRVAFVNPRHIDAEIQGVMSGWLREREVFTPRAAEFKTIVYDGSPPVVTPRSSPAMGNWVTLAAWLMELPMPQLLATF